MKKIILFFLIAALGLSGCRGNNEKTTSDEKTIEENIEENPFDIEDIEMNGVEVEYNYGYGIKNYDAQKCEIDLKEDELRLEIEYSNNNAAFEGGLLLFVDGIAQKYSLDGKEGYMVPFEVAEGTNEKVKKKVSITFKPQCTLKGGEHTLYLGSILNPSYRVSESDNIYGNNLQLLPSNTWKLHYCTTTEKIEVSKESKNIPLTEEIKQNYIIENENGKKRNKLKTYNVTFLEQDGTKLEGSSIDINKPVQLISVGGTVSKYRLCCMVNHEPYPAFQGKCYMDIEVGKDEMTQATLDFTKGKDKIQENSCMYVLLCPFTDNGIPKEDFMWDKTNTYTIVNK